MLLPEPQLYVAFQSSQSGHHKQALQLLRDIDKNFVVCLVDVEFGTVRGFNAIPYQISIRNDLSGEIVLSTFVHYSSRESTDIEDEIAQIPPPNSWVGYVTASYMSSVYGTDRTMGLSLGAIGRACVSAGFILETHRIFSWYCAWDTITFSRALHNDSHLLSRRDTSKIRHILDASDAECYQPVQLGP
jgi:hypothetical protein